MTELSKETIDFLDYHGYKYRKGDGIILIKKIFDYTTPIVISTIVFFVTLPLFPYGLVFFALFVLSFYSYKRYKDTFSIAFQPELEKLNYEFYGTRRRLLFKHVSAIYLRSNFKNEYSSAFKRTNEEYQITIGMELVRGDRYELFRFISDYQEPSKEIMEVHDHLKAILSK